MNKYIEILRTGTMKQGDEFLGYTFETREIWLNIDHVVSMRSTVFHGWDGDPKGGWPTSFPATEVKTVLGDTFILDGTQTPIRIANQ